MKTLPPLTLDLRRDTLAKGGDYIEVIDAHERTVARIFAIDGDYDHAGLIVDRVNGWQKTVKALRALAIVDTHAPAIQQVVVDGNRCHICASTWKLNMPEQHQSWCALKGTEQ